MKIKRCPYCKVVISWSYPKVGFGNPIHQCEVCKNNYIDDEITEWDYLTLWGKITHILAFIRSLSMLTYFGIPLGTMLILSAFIGDEAIYKFFSWNNPYISIFICAYILICITFTVLYTRSFREEIRQSKIRTSDPLYQEYLKTYEIVRPHEIDYEELIRKKGNIKM